MSTTSLRSCALEALRVTKTLLLGRERIPVLRGVNLQIDRGEFAAIMGPSGSGKSTLLGILAGLDSPSGGKILIDGQDVTRMSEARLAGVRNQKIGMVFQAYNLIPTLTAQENVEAPLAIGRHTGDPAAQARAVLALVGLGHRLRNRPHQLSGGEQQRVAIARALVTGPAIVIMDEPTGNLDRANSDNLLHLIGEVQRQTGTTFLIATHDGGVAGAASRVIHLVDGRIAE
jgi:putative ABC transport system ATP-binding protein